MYKKKKAMSLLSLLLILSMIVTIMAVSVPLISQNITKISKGKHKEGEISLDQNGGHFICYYNKDNKLSYKQIEFDANGNVHVIGSGEDVNKCIFKVPEAELYTVTLVGGGGGGASTYVENDFDYSVIKDSDSDNFMLSLSGGLKLSPSLFSRYSEYINEFKTQNAIRNLVGNTSYIAGGEHGVCIKDESVSLRDGESFEIETEEILDGTVVKRKISRKQKDEGWVERVAYNDENCGTSIYPDTCGCTTYNTTSEYVDKYGIKFKINNSKTIFLRDTSSLPLELISYAAKVRQGAAGNPGEIKQYKTAYIASSGTQEITFEGSSIGQGGAGGNKNDETNYGSGAKGGDTTVTLNGVKMIASGGEGGSRRSPAMKTLKYLKESEKGEDGIRSEFYIPSMLTINEKNLGVATGSRCTAKENACTQIDDTKYPGSGGASSGYNIGTDTLKLPSGISLDNAEDMVRVQISNGSDEGHVALYPLFYNYSNDSPYRPNLTPVMGNGGRGANGAILISW